MSVPGVQSSPKSVLFLTGQFLLPNSIKISICVDSCAYLGGFGLSDPTTFLPITVVE